MPRLAPIPGIPARRPADTAVARFLGDERGSLLIFGLLFFILILGFTGIAVDVARFEAERTAMQNAVDRGVLAATDLDQTIDSELVVRDYVEKAGYDGDDVDVTVSETRVGAMVAGRRVSATTNLTQPTFFMRLIGYDDLNADVRGTATEAVTNIEIAMVLDTSGSMGGNGRMGYLKDAARGFIDTMLPKGEADEGAGLTSIAIVPYSMSVNLGEHLTPQYDLSDEHTYSTCAFFDSHHYDTLALGPSDELRRYTHFDHSNKGVDGDHEINRPLCPRGNRNPIIAPTIDRTRLLDAVDELEPYSSTGIDIGMKWGLAMLDPSTRPVVSNLVSAGRIDHQVRGRPAPYGSDANDWKVIVLMTDGNNDEQRDLREELRTGISPIFFDEGRQRFSVLLEGRLPLFCDTDGDGIYEADTDGDDAATESWDNDGEHDARFVSEEECRDALDDDDDIFEDREITWYWERGNHFRGWPDTAIAGDGARRDEWQHLDGRIDQLNWIDVWNYVPLGTFWDDFFKQPYQQGYVTNAQRSIFRNPRDDQTSLDDTEERLTRLCDQARVLVEKDGEERPKVRIYSVILDAPSQHAADLLEDCATSPNDAFDVRGTEISNAFDAIANNISELRLVQ